MEESHLAENESERERLEAFVQRADNALLRRPLPAGWTVSAILAHIAFWDARVLCLLNRWESGIDPDPTDCEPDDLDWVNDASKPLCLAIEPSEAALLAVDLAGQADQRIAAMSNELLDKFRAAGSPFNLSRADHRRQHLDEIDAVLTGLTSNSSET